MWIDSIKAGIDQLENLDISSPHVFENAIAAYKSMGRLPAFINDHPYLPINMFRTRTHSTDNYFNRISDIGLPPADAIKKFARCNVPGHSVFYCSEDRVTSYAELLEYWAKEKKDPFLYVTISKWEIANKLKMLIVVSPNKGDRASKFDIVHGDAFDRFMSKLSNEQKDATSIFYKFLFDRFRKPAKNDLHTYIITSSLCYLVFHHKSDPVDAIFYPSVPFEGRGVNLAINESYDFESNVTLRLVARNKFARVDNFPEPSFEEVELVEAVGFDASTQSILWP